MSPGTGAMPRPAGSGVRGLGSGRHRSPHPHPGTGTQGQSIPALPAREGLALTDAKADAWGCWDWATQPPEAWRRAGLLDTAQRSCASLPGVWQTFQNGQELGVPDWGWEGVSAATGAWSGCPRVWILPSCGEWLHTWTDVVQRLRGGRAWPPARQGCPGQPGGGAVLGCARVAPEGFQGEPVCWWRGRTSATQMGDWGA